MEPTNNNDLHWMIDITRMNLFHSYVKTRFDNWHDCNLNANYIQVCDCNGWKCNRYTTPPPPKIWSCIIMKWYTMNTWIHKCWCTFKCSIMPAIRLVNNPTCSCLCLWWNLCRFQSINTNCLWAFVHKYFECLVARLNHFEGALIGYLQWWMLGTYTSKHIFTASQCCEGRRCVNPVMLWGSGAGLSEGWEEWGIPTKGLTDCWLLDANSPGSSGLSPKTIPAGEVCRSSFVAVQSRTHGSSSIQFPSCKRARKDAFSERWKRSTIPLAWGW